MLNSMISPNQKSFLPGRGTEANYIVASEILHSMRTRKGNKGWMAIKIDDEKAYDKLERGFIYQVLKDHGFDSATCQLIMSCITSVSSSVKINGNLTNFFPTSRGIRQVCNPTSSYFAWIPNNCKSL